MALLPPVNSDVAGQDQNRWGRNPQTGEEMTITARSILTYHPSVVLKNKLNGINKAG
jgi:integration host factor subunit alpha